MGRFVKNAELKAQSYAMRAPISSSSFGPEAPINGQFRFNTDTTRLEVFYDMSWYSIGYEGKITITKDTLVGDGATTSFPMTVPHEANNEAEILVFVGSIYQNPGVAYTTNANTIEFTSPPDLDSPIVILHNFNSNSASVSFNGAPIQSQ